MKVLGTTGQVIVTLFAILVVTVFAAAGNRDASSDLAVNVILSLLEIIAVCYGLFLIGRRDPHTPRFWSIFLIFSAAIQLFWYLLLDGGWFALLLAANSAGWQVYWQHSRHAAHVFR